jgi:hypothetical protein
VRGSVPRPGVTQRSAREKRGRPPINGPTHPADAQTDEKPREVAVAINTVLPDSIDGASDSVVVEGEPAMGHGIVDALKYANVRLQQGGRPPAPEPAPAPPAPEPAPFAAEPAIAIVESY